MRILILTDSYPPELRSAAQLMKDLAEGLTAEGHGVTVATSEPQYNLAEPTGHIPEDRVENGVRVVRIKALPHHGVPHLIRGINQLFLSRIFFRAVRHLNIEAPEVVIVHSPPLPLVLAAGRLARHFGAKFIANVHDIFPQNGIDLVTAWKKPLIRLAFGGMEKKVYAMADTIVVPSESHKNYLNQKRAVALEKLAVIPHWIDISPFERAKNTGRFRKQYSLEGKLIFLFAGVLGPSQGLGLILDLADKVRTKTDISFLIIGEGSEKERLVKLAKRKNLSNVYFEPFVSAEDYPNLLKEVDVGLIVLTEKNTTPAVPAKLMGYMAAGLPVVAFLHKESDGNLIVKDACCGYSAFSSDKRESLSIIEQIYEEKAKLVEYGANAYNYTRKHFQKEVCIKQWDVVLKNF